MNDVVIQMKIIYYSISGIVTRIRPEEWLSPTYVQPCGAYIFLFECPAEMTSQTIHPLHVLHTPTGLKTDGFFFNPPIFPMDISLVPSSGDRRVAENVGEWERKGEGDAAAPMCCESTCRNGNGCPSSCEIDHCKAFGPCSTGHMTPSSLSVCVERRDALVYNDRVAEEAP